MIALIQRVSEASVSVAGERIAQIEQGLLVLVGVEKDDTSENAQKLCERVLGYRIFPDADGRMNLDVLSSGGGLLLVPQFTLAADTSKGRRPGFSQAASPDAASRLFDEMAGFTQQRLEQVELGRFGADMKVALINDGPVTFWLTA